MARNVCKTQIAGYALDLNRSGEQGQENWERTSTLFISAYEAHQYRTAHYPHVKKFRVYAQRVNIEKIAIISGTNTEERLSPSRKGL